MNAPSCPVHVSRKMELDKQRPKLNRGGMQSWRQELIFDMAGKRWRCPVSGCPQVKAEGR